MIKTDSRPFVLNGLKSHPFDLKAGSPLLEDKGVETSPGNFLRDAMPKEVYTRLLALPKHPRQQPLHYYRFLLYLVVSRHTGLRVVDVGRLTRDQVTALLQGKRIQVVEKKNRKPRKIGLSSTAREELESISPAIDFVFDRQSTLMGTEHSRNWARFVNSTLKRNTDSSGLYLRSHSMRIAFITHLLTLYPILRVSQIVNHSSVSVTERYDRHTIDHATLEANLDTI